MKRYLTTLFLAITANLLMAGNDSMFNTNNIILYTIAVLALILSIFNYFRMSYIQKRYDAEINNQKDDMTVSLERFKNSLFSNKKSNGYRNNNQRKDNQPKKVNTQPVNKNVEKPKIVTEKVEKPATVGDNQQKKVDNSEQPKKPSRKYYQKYRKPTNKKADENTKPAALND